MFIYLLLVLSILSNVHAQQEPSAEKLITIPINLQVTLHNNNTPSQAIISDAPTSIPITVSSNCTQQTITSGIDDIKKHSLHYCSNAWNTVKNIWLEHKISLLLLTVLSSWIGTNVFCLYSEYRLLNGLCWARFKETVSLEQLKQQDQQELGNELLLTIQRTYASEHYLNDFFTPLLNFFNDLKTEIKMLERFIKVRHYIKRLRMERLFPPQEKALDRAEDALERARYLQELFIQWMTEYKIQLHIPHVQAC